VATLQCGGLRDKNPDFPYEAFFAQDEEHDSEEYDSDGNLLED